MSYQIDDLRRFIEESNHIEGKHDTVSPAEFQAYERFLELDEIKIADILALAACVPLDRPAALRNLPGMDIVVGDHRPQPGGPEIPGMLAELLVKVNDPDIQARHAMTTDVHVAYETLHPLMDGNGRTGRAIFLWMDHRAGRRRVWKIGFQHEWYYRTLGLVRGLHRSKSNHA